MTSQEIKNLQVELNKRGANIPVDGILGPNTISAMNDFTKTVSAPTAPGQMTPADIMDLQLSLNERGANLKVDGVLGPKTTEAMNRSVATSLATNPNVSRMLGQNSTESIVNAYMTGDWTGVADITGKPFSSDLQQQAVKQAEKALAPAFRAQVSQETAGVEDSLAGQQANYGQFLKNEADSFQEDKTALDQNAADQGVLFSGSRVQKENNLQKKYEDRQAYQQGVMERSIGGTARDFQYRYGDDAAKNLSSYYNTRGNQYNPNVARGGVSSGSLASIYDPRRFNFQGTAVTANKAATQTRAASLLANRANKLTSTGYQNQF